MSKKRSVWPPLAVSALLYPDPARHSWLRGTRQQPRAHLARVPTASAATSWPESVEEAIAASLTTWTTVPCVVIGSRGIALTTHAISCTTTMR